MNIEDFKKRTIIPEMPIEEAPVEEPTPTEHPNTPILENMMMNEDEKFGENNQLLEHILMKIDENSDKTVEEFQLLKQDETVNELKSLRETISEKEPNRIIIGGGSKVTAVKGVKGDKGDRGEKGDKGDKGERGPKGEKGDKGERGYNGLDGRDGIDGKDGENGLDGVDGKNGRDGINGKDGKDGKDAKVDLEKLKEEVTSGIRFDKIKGAPQFIKGSIGRATEFKELTDVPKSYVGQASKTVAVKSDEKGLEFVDNISTDEKVKYDVNDPTAGYVADKFVAGTGITVAEGAGADENKLKITNSAPDQTVAISNGTGITVSGTYPNFTVTNSAPDQTVAITAGTNITSVTGTYPNFTINAATQTTDISGKEDVSNKDTTITLGTSDVKYPSQNAVKVYVDNVLGNANALVYKGVIDCAANPNYPAADAGHLYIVSVAGKIGGASGIEVEVGDMAICNTDSTVTGDQATVGTYWNIIQKNIVGAVTGPASAVADDIAVFDSNTGKVIKDGGAKIADFVTKALYDANSILYATTDNTPVALTVGEQTVVGRTTGGAIATLAIDSDLSSVSANDDTLPSAKATKTALDAKLAIASKATASEVATGTDNDKYTTPLAVAPYANQSLYRQAIINGNFDVWQRGTSATIPAGSFNYYTADRWYIYNGATGSTLVSSQQSFTVGQTDVPNNPKYYFRNDLSDFTTGNVDIEYKIEDVTLFSGKTFTLSFWAKADASTSLDIYRYRNYGSGGSTSEYGSATTETITTSWAKYTYTISVPSLSGKTIGAGNHLGLLFRIAENTVLDIAQFQVCAGSVALPFQPKSFAEELRDCQRYYQKIGPISTYSRLASDFIASSSTAAEALLNFRTQMRVAPTLSYNASIGTYRMVGGSTNVVLTSLAVDANQTDSKQAVITAGAASGLTDGKVYFLRAENDATAYIDLSAEL